MLTRFYRTIAQTLFAIVICPLLINSFVNLFMPQLILSQIAMMGFSVDQAPLLGLIIGLCCVIFALPRTRVIGAILITAFLGGTIAARYRVGEAFSPSQFASALLGFATWTSLWLTDLRLRKLFV